MSQLLSSPVDISLAREGACKVLAECLELKEGNCAAIFYDDETIAPAKLLIEEAHRLNLQTRERFVPIKHQLTYSEATGLCENCRAALRGNAAVITCLSADSATTPYRREIVRKAANGTTKVGHIPGASLFVLASAINVDYQDTVTRCEDLALALAVGQHATLTTYVMGPDGEPSSAYTLHIELGGFRRMPVVSTGVIAPGTWGNLLSGETFIAPIEDAANGEIAINGAFKNHVLDHNEALVLRFEASRLAGLPRGTENIVRAFNTLLAHTRSRGDCDSLAEFGIGVNKAIKHLTGNSLFDEKCAGTVHIALGDSSGFGGRYQCDLHEDFITRQPTVTIDGKPILEFGSDVFRESDWYEDLDTFPVDERLSPATPVMKSSAERAVVRAGELKVNHQVGAGRVCMYRVGRATQSSLLRQLYDQLPALGAIKFSDLSRSARRNGFSESQVARGVSILIRHRLVSLS